jgi:hypothetical protein
MRGGELENDVSTPRLPGDDGALQPEHFDQPSQVFDVFSEAATSWRLLTQPMPALVVGHSSLPPLG